MFNRRASQAFLQVSENLLFRTLSPQTSTRSSSHSMSTSNTLPIPTPDAPRKRSIFEITFDTDFTLYDDSNSALTPCANEPLDLEDITKRGVSKAFNFAQQEYQPMYHPFDAQGEYPEPFEWERMFDDLNSLSKTRSPSITSINSIAPAAGSRRASIQSSQISPYSRRNSCADSIAAKSCRRSGQDQPLLNRRLSALFANFSFLSGDSQAPSSSICRCRSQDLNTSAKTSRTSLSVSSAPLSPASSHCHGGRRNSRSRRRSYNRLLLSHIGAGHAAYRMDSGSEDLQKSVAGIPISAFIHPKMHIPASNSYGAVEEDCGFEDAYPLRLSKLWAFDEPSLPVERCDPDRYEKEAKFGGGISPFTVASVI